MRSSPATRSSADIILILSVSGFASTFASRSIEPLVGVIARDLAADPKTVALLSTAFALPYAFIQPVLGPIGDALGKERVVKICLGIIAAALLAFAVAPTLGPLFGLRILAGMAAGGVVPLALAMIGDHVAMERRQVAISRFLVAVILGQLAGSSLSGVLAVWIGWRGVFALAAGLAAAAFVATLVSFRGAAPPGRFDLATALARYRGLLMNPRARTLFGSVFIEAIAIFGVFPYMAPLIEARGEGGSSEAGLVIGGFALGGLLYSALVGLLLRFLGPTRMLMAGGAISGAALLMLGSASAWTLDAAAMLVMGLGFYMLHNTYQTQVTELSPEARASAVALHAFSFFVGQALSVVLVGAGLRMIGQTGTFALCAVAALALGIGSATILARLPRKSQPLAR